MLRKNTDALYAVNNFSWSVSKIKIILPSVNFRDKQSTDALARLLLTSLRIMQINGTKRFVNLKAGCDVFIFYLD